MKLDFHLTNEMMVIRLMISLTTLRDFEFICYWKNKRFRKIHWRRCVVGLKTWNKSTNFNIFSNIIVVTQIAKKIHNQQENINFSRSCYRSIPSYLLPGITMNELSKCWHKNIGFHSISPLSFSLLYISLSLRAFGDNANIYSQHQESISISIWEQRHRKKIEDGRDGEQVEVTSRK